jgi:hypothetical protein
MIMNSNENPKMVELYLRFCKTKALSKVANKIAKKFKTEPEGTY